MDEIVTIYVRHRIERVARKFGPKDADHPSVGRECPACRQPLKAGDHTALIVLGPGDDPQAREKAREGRYFSAVAIEVHWPCMTGEE